MKKFKSCLVLVIALVLAISTVVSAEKTFTDVKAKDWHYKAVMNLAGRGGIAGYADGTFKPNGTITFSEFLKMSLSSATGKDYPAAKGHHWASGVYAEAIKLGIIDGKEFPGVSETLNKPITREDMTMILLNINIKIQGEANVDTSKTAAKIKDIDKVSANRKSHVLQSYEKGLITGKGNGFDPQGVTTRAEASAVIIRMLDKETRVDPTAPPVEIPATGAREIKAGQGVLAPKVGDVFIKADGTKVVLKEGPGGVLGAGQGVDIYSGYKFNDGSKFKHGDLGEIGHDDAITGRTFLGQPYSVHPKTGEGHFRDEWLRMETALKKEAIEKYGMDAPDGFIYKDYVRFDAGAGWTFLAKGLEI